ncbi:hypothetical protein PFWH6_4940 [Pseudomonas fluorescens WH6]|nr:hypothetical protein PFWH6_4940 [Pseudomonas fluorescens WH6]
MASEGHGGSWCLSVKMDQIMNEDLQNFRAKWWVTG